MQTTLYCELYVLVHAHGYACPDPCVLCGPHLWCLHVTVGLYACACACRDQRRTVGPFLPFLDFLA